MTFDASGRLIGKGRPKPGRITRLYAANTISVATQDGHTVTATLAGGLVVSFTGPGARTTPSYTYTAGSTAQLATVTDGRGKVWQYEYDSNGRMTQAKTPEQGRCRGRGDEHVRHVRADRDADDPPKPCGRWSYASADSDDVHVQRQLPLPTCGPTSQPIPS